MAADASRAQLDSAANDGAAAGTALAGSLVAVVAYGIWGVAPLYFRWLEGIGSVEIVAHRVVWTALILLPLLLLTGGRASLTGVLADSRRWSPLVVSSVLIGANWLLFIYAIESARIIEASLGYFINPLISLVLGMLFLGERMRPLQWIAVALAVLGVGNEIVRFGSVPWLGLALAFSFGFYGLVRKRLDVPADQDGHPKDAFADGSSHIGLLVGGQCRTLYELDLP